MKKVIILFTLSLMMCFVSAQNKIRMVAEEIPPLLKKQTLQFDISQFKKTVARANDKRTESTAVCLYDSGYVYKPKGTTIVKLHSKNLYTYDSKGNLTSDLVQELVNNVWVNFSHLVYTYDAKNNKTSELFKNWINNTWENIHQYSYIYDANNNLIDYLTQKWWQNAWVYDYKFHYAYNVNNSKVLFQGFTWDMSGSSWNNYTETSWTFDINNNMTSKVSTLYGANYSKILYTYNTSNHIINQLDHKWENNTWEIEGQTVYSYDANNNLIKDLFQSWVNNTWVNSMENIYTYDSNNNIATESNFFGGKINSKYIYTYDVNNNLQSIEHGGVGFTSPWVTFIQNFTYCSNNCQYSSSWDFQFDVGGVWTKGDSLVTFCKTVSTGIIEKNTDNYLVAFYPNPSNGQLDVEMKDLELNNSELKIYDVLGELVFRTLIQNPKSKIDLSFNPKGIYFYQLNSKDKTYSGKIIIDK